MSEDRIGEDAHAPLGPSKADGWSTCLDYVNANEGLPDDPSFPAAEGTAAHAISDLCLKLGFDAADAIGWKTKLHTWDFVWTEEDAQLLQWGLDRVRRRPGPFFGERRVNIEPWTIPGQFGTLDRAGFDDEYIWVEDLKWGRFPVYPVGNLQIALYGLGFWRDVAEGHTKARKFLLSIDQPRCAGGGGVWETTLGELLRIGDWLRERAELTQQPNPPRTASDLGCVWCRRRKAPGGCPTYDEFNTALIGQTASNLDFEILMGNELTVPDPRSITPERRAFILSHRKMLETWMEQLEAQELADYLAGLPTPGRKAVVDTQKGTRDKWTDEAAAAAILEPQIGDQAFTKKLITPKQASKKINSETFDKLRPYFQPGEPGKSMVPEADGRQAIPVIVPDDFDDLPASE